MQGLTDDQITDLKLKDEWEGKCIPSGGAEFKKDEIGRRNGHGKHLGLLMKSLFCIWIQQPKLISLFLCFRTQRKNEECFEEDCGRSQGIDLKSRFGNKLNSFLDCKCYICVCIILILFYFQKQVQANVCVTMDMVKEALDQLRGAVMIVYPMGLPPHDPIRMELENQEDLAGTQVVWHVCSHQCLPTNPELILCLLAAI